MIAGFSGLMEAGGNEYQHLPTCLCLATHPRIGTNSRIHARISEVHASVPVSPGLPKWTECPAFQSLGTDQFGRVGASACRLCFSPLFPSPDSFEMPAPKYRSRQCGLNIGSLVPREQK